MGPPLLNGNEFSDWLKPRCQTVLQSEVHYSVWASFKHLSDQHVTQLNSKVFLYPKISAKILFKIAYIGTDTNKFCEIGSI